MNDATLRETIAAIDGLERACEKMRDAIGCHKHEEILTEWHMDEWNWIRAIAKGDGRSELVCVRPDKSNFDGDEIYSREKSYELDTEAEGIDCIRQLKQLYAALIDDDSGSRHGLSGLISPATETDAARWIEMHFDPRLRGPSDIQWTAWSLDSELKRWGWRIPEEQLEDL